MASPISEISDDLIKSLLSPQQGAKELNVLSCTNKRFLTLFGPQCAAAELLFCVLNINEARKKRNSSGNYGL